MEKAFCARRCAFPEFRGPDCGLPLAGFALWSEPREIRGGMFAWCVVARLLLATKIKSGGSKFWRPKKLTEGNPPEVSPRDTSASHHASHRAEPPPKQRAVRRSDPKRPRRATCEHVQTHAMHAEDAATPPSLRQTGWKRILQG
jgi:hypothetical protein